MLPPREQSQFGLVRTCLSLVSPGGIGSRKTHEQASMSEKLHESPSESASSRETCPTEGTFVGNKMGKEKQGENDCTDLSIIHHVSPASEKLCLRDMAAENIDYISERMLRHPEEFLEQVKAELQAMLMGTGSRDDYLEIQKLVLARSDLTAKSLATAHRAHLEILVAIKTGIQAFLHPSISLSVTSLIEVFMYRRCRNIACQSLIPAENCNCQICTGKNGFCNLCMCVICNKFDFEVNTCRWIGCDLCSHWTHTDCAISDGLIGMGPCLKLGASLSEMLIRCRACNGTSELMGWVKDVFEQCAPSWAREALARELDYVSRIFRGSGDTRGRNLFWKCEDLIEKMKGGMAESIACKAILNFFHDIDGDPLKTLGCGEEGGGGMMAPQEACSRIAEVVQEAIRKMEMVGEEKLQLCKKARLVLDACDRELEEKAREVSELKVERQRKKLQVEELEKLVRLKLAEADMFQLKASEARREADRLQRIALAKSEKSEEEYASRYLKLRLSEAEAEKQYLFEKLKYQEGRRVGPEISQSCNNAGGSDHSQMLMFSKIHDLLKNVYMPPKD